MLNTWFYLIHLVIFTQILISQIFECTSLIITLIATLTFILQFSFEDEDSENAPLRMIESFTIIYFTFEYIIRFSCSPNKWRFFKHPINLVDLFAILPFYLTFALDQLEDLQIIAKAGKTIRLVRVLRIIRIFKLVRHFSGLQSLIQTLSDAYKELGLLMMIVFISILSFTVLIFYAEKTDSREDLTDKRNGKIKTILGIRKDTSWSFIDSLCWCIMTLTTVGSSHSYPSTTLGQLVGSLCTVAGVLILSLPIPIVVNSFASSYKNQMWRHEVAYKKSKRLELAKKTLTKNMAEKIIKLEKKNSRDSVQKTRDGSRTFVF